MPSITLCQLALWLLSEQGQSPCVCTLHSSTEQALHGLNHITLCCVVWCGVVWYGTVWCGVV